MLQTRRSVVILFQAVLSCSLLLVAQRLKAELVLRLDASDLSTLTLSSDQTTGTLFGFPDARQTGLKFVEGWGQKYGATGNPLLSPSFAPLRVSAVNPNLYRPTYDPNGLGSGKPSVNFDFSAGDVVLGNGQRMVASLDNLINSNQYTIFFVGQALDTRFQAAFGQDFNFRPSGWDVGVDGTAEGNWEGRPGGYDGNVDNGESPAGTSTGVGVRSIVGTATGTLDFSARDSGGNLLTNSHPQTDYGIFTGGDFTLGNRGGWDQSNSKPFNGRIGEIDIFNRELSATDQTAVRAYLENKWTGGPAPTPTQLTTALSLLQQAPPSNLQQIVRYEFHKELPTQPDSALINPDWVASHITATDINSGGGFPPTMGVPGGFSSSSVGISANSGYLGTSWDNNTSEQSPNNSSPYYLGFTVTPDAGKQILPSKLSFAIAPGEDQTAAPNATDSYGVWVNSGSGFVKVGGQVSIGPPPNSAQIVPYMFQTVTVDLSSVAAFKNATEVRIYFWHQGALVNPNGNENARVDNFRLIGLVQDIPAGVVGDYNSDGVVNAADYTVWRDHLGQNFSLPNRDPANSGAVSALDYTSWKNHFGQSGSGSLGSGAVPEPSASALLIGGLITLLVYRLHRRPEINVFEF